LTNRVLLITPPYHCGVVESAGTWIPLALACVADGIRREGFEVEIYDAMGRFDTFEDIAAKIKDYQPDVVGSGGYTATTPDAIEVLRIAKEINSSTITLLGGIHTTFMWEEALRQHNGHVDYALIGEADRTGGQLLTAVRDGTSLDEVPCVAWWDADAGQAVRSTAPAQRFHLDEITPAYDLIDWPIYEFRPNPGSTLAIVTSSRGCVQKCSFCSQQLFYDNHWSAKTPEAFVDELKMLNERFGVDVAMLSDEVPTLDRERWERILDLLIQEKPGVELLLETRVDDILRDEDILPRYREAGIVHIYVGVESGSQVTLDQFKKDVTVEQNRRALELINEQDIISETAFVLGMPDETKENIDATIALAKQYNPDMAFFMAIAPWPYADIYPDLEPSIESFEYRDYNLIEPVVKPDTMTREEFKAELFRAFHSFYFDKMTRLDEMTPFKRDYMISVFKLLREHSYLKDQMKDLKLAEKQGSANGKKMPDAVKKMLASL